MDIMHGSTGFATKTLCTAAALLMAAAGALAFDKPEWSERNPVTAELTGAKEVPPVATPAYGKSTIKVAKDRKVAGSVIVFDMKPTSAHIHQGPIHRDGPVVIPLVRTSDTVFSVPANTRLTEEQYARFREGDLYINVHSDKFPTGEIRAQMRP